MPVLIAAGRYDKACSPKFTIRYKEYCPQAQFVMFEHAGHFSQVEEPEKEFAVIKEFMRK
jgi:proline iminopeptidase